MAHARSGMWWPLLVGVMAASARAQDVASSTSAATPFGVALAAARADGTLSRIEP